MAVLNAAMISATAMVCSRLRSRLRFRFHYRLCCDLGGRLSQGLPQGTKCWMPPTSSAYTRVLRAVRAAGEMHEAQTRLQRNKYSRGMRIRMPLAQGIGLKE